MNLENKAKEHSKKYFIHLQEVAYAAYYVGAEDIIEDLEMLIINNEDDFDRGKGKYILREFINKLKYV